MKWFGRIFANAIARRLAYVVVAAILAVAGIGTARAQAFPVCGNSPVTCTLPEAEAAVNNENGMQVCKQVYGNDPDLTHSTPTNTVTDAPVSQVRTYYVCHFTWGGPINGAWASYYYKPKDCSTEEPLPETAGTVPSNGNLGFPANDPNGCPITTCYDGCEFLQPASVTMTYLVIDGVAHCKVGGWRPTGSQCTATPQVPTPENPPADSDGDGSSDANDGNPNNPGSDGTNQGQDESRACGGQGQPECAEDGSNAGTGNGNTSGGGGNCQSPPTSSGDAILAQIAFQTWATRCAVEGNANAGTGTGTTPGPGDDGVKGVLEEIRDYLDGNGQAIEDPEDPWIEGDGPEPSDWSMGLGSGSCPAPISETISLGGHSASVQFSFQPLCDLAGLLNALFRALGLLIGAYIIAGVRR